VPTQSGTTNVKNSIADIETLPGNWIPNINRIKVKRAQLGNLQKHDKINKTIKKLYIHELKLSKICIYTVLLTNKKNIIRTNASDLVITQLNSV
jgi:hypothetical protein